MTTIAYDGRFLVADGRLSMGNEIMNDSAVKIFDVKGTIYAFAGSRTDTQTYIDWLLSGSDMSVVPELEQFSALEIKDGVVNQFYDCKQYINIVEPYVAIGSGSVFARCAMDLGLDAFDAVAYACTRDIYSSKPTSFVDFSISNKINIVTGDKL